MQKGRTSTVVVAPESTADGRQRDETSVPDTISAGRARAFVYSGVNPRAGQAASQV